MAVDRVDRPQPGDVPDSSRAEEGDDVPPGRHEYRRRRVLVSPGVPVAVHLVAEAQDDRVTVGADGLGVGGQVAVVAPSPILATLTSSGSICTSGTACSSAAAAANLAWNGSSHPL